MVGGGGETLAGTSKVTEAVTERRQACHPSFQCRTGYIMSSTMGGNERNKIEGKRERERERGKEEGERDFKIYI